MPTRPTTRVIEHLRTAVLRDGAGLGDGELLGRFLERRDEAALAALVKRHGPMVWGVCRRLLYSHHDAEDAFQAAFLVLVRKAASVRPREMVGNWLYGVAHQAALQARRAAARRRAREVQVAVMPDTEAVQRDPACDVRPLLDEELSRLPDRYRAVIVLCDLEGRTRREVARQLGVPEGTVGGRLARARAMLAKRLTARGVTLSVGALAAVLANNASAGLPDTVLSSTIRAASTFAAGQAAAGMISVKAAAVTEGVLKAMLLSKLKIATAVLLVAVAAAGSGGFLYRIQAAQPGAQPALSPVAAETKAQSVKKPEAGDPREALQRKLSEVELTEAERQVEIAELRLRAAKERLRRLKQLAEPAKAPGDKGDGAGEEDDVADVPSEDLRAGKDDNKRYFLIGPGKDARRPKEGYGLVVILPGGPGSADFHPFVKRIYKYALPAGYLAAQPVAVKWTDEQAIVWPTRKNPVEGMKFSTEDFVAAVIKEVAAKHKVNPKRVFTLSWSSSGPAAYAISLSDKGVTGSFIAMSVFNPRFLPPLEKARGHAYYLYHSPDDRVCPYRMAEQAARDLKASQAKVKLATYEGGHGWRGGLYQNMRQGIEWLEKNTTPPASKEDAPKKGAARSDRERIQGTWRPVKMEVNGVEVPFAFLQPKEGFWATFTGEKWTSNFMGGEVFTFQLDPAGKPKAIDLHPLENVEKTLLGIYRLEDDRLTICFCRMGKQERPSEFENYWRAASRTALIVLERQAEKADKPPRDQEEVWRRLDKLIKELEERRKEADPDKETRQLLEEIRKNPALLAGDCIWSQLGMLLQPAEAADVKRVNPQLHGGLLVGEVRAGSSAARAGIRAGDILVGLHQYETLSRENVLWVLNHPDLATFQPFRFYLLRSGQVHRGTLQAASKVNK